MEHQRESIHYCPHCPGYMAISTESSGSRTGDKSAFAVVLQQESCPACREHGKDALIKAKRQRDHQYFVLQDKKEDSCGRI
jgi:hypothetical protein